ncbi:MAG: hypothetical protein WAK60_11585 [Sedimentisphaerales bacterium]
MKQNIRNSGNEGSRFFGPLAAEKKKTVIVACLIAVMVFVWGRVLERKVPQSTEAAVVTQEMTKSQANLELKISFIELPKVKGRNDVLTRDFFAVEDWRDFMKSGEGKSSGGIEEQ